MVERRQLLSDGARRSMPSVVAAWVISRTIACAALVIGTSIKVGTFTFAGLVSWDGEWYLRIAQHGYGPPPVAGTQTPWPFFPLLPGLTRALMEVGIPAKAAMVVITNVAFLVALAGVHTIARRHGGDATARWAVWIVALFPMSIVFSMGYPSSIFLAATTWAFVFLEDRRDLAAGLCALAATAVRPNGGVIVIALVLALVVRRDYRRVVAVALPATAFVITWCGLLWRWTGNPLVFWATKNAWGETTIVEFFHGTSNGESTHLMLAALAVVALVAWGRHLPVPWLVYAALYLAPSLVLGVLGLGRYVNECFPVFVAAGIGAAAAADRIRLPLLLVASTTSMATIGLLVINFVP